MINNRDYRLITFYNGEPHRSPEINFEVYATKLCERAIRQTTFQEVDSIISAESSLTVGIFGPWGSGKSTLMRLIKKKLDERFNNTNCKTIWFNPWKYEGKEEVCNALIQTILRAIAKDFDKSVKISETRRKSLIEICRRFALITGRVTAKIPIAYIKQFTGIDVSQDIGDDLNQLFGDDVDDPYSFINRFEEGFGNAVNEYVGENGKLIVFVDDLDRCLPENALTVLESLKLYLDKANCVFFIGLDKRVIEQAIRHRYKNMVDVTGEEYIKKMIQLNFFLPDKDPIEVRKILQVGLNSSYARNDKIWKLIQDATQSNVRRVKQFTIAFDLIEDIAKELGIIKIKSDVQPKMAKILLIQMNFPSFLDALQKNSCILKKFEKIFESENKDLDRVKTALANDSDGKRFYEDDHLINFLMENTNYPQGMAEPDSIKELLQILSRAGNNAGKT